LPEAKGGMIVHASALFLFGRVVVVFSYVGDVFWPLAFDFVKKQKQNTTHRSLDRFLPCQANEIETTVTQKILVFFL
jgi:hypothetical protein